MLLQKLQTWCGVRSAATESVSGSSRQHYRPMDNIETPCVYERDTIRVLIESVSSQLYYHLTK